MFDNLQDVGAELKVTILTHAYFCLGDKQCVKK